MRYLAMAGALIFSLAAMAAPRGGIFIPRNGGYEGRVGQAHVMFDQSQGGAMRVVAGEWPNLKTLARFNMVFAAQGQGDEDAVEVKQDNDRSPELNFLEEGNQRIGLRVKFKLYDANNRYFGNGMTETWIYPSGEMYVTACSTFENAALAPKVAEGAIEVEVAPEYASTLAGLADQPVEVNDKGIPGRCISFNLQGGNADLPGGLAVYWRTGNMQHNTFIYRTEKGAPNYYRWPDYFRQAYGGGEYLKTAMFADKKLSLRWDAEGKTSFNGVFRIAALPENTVKTLIAAEKEPVKLAVTGGVVHGDLGGYNDAEGAYEVRKIADPLTITLPADPQGRIIRIKTIAISQAGAVTAALDGKALVPQLTSEGGIADDPMAPLHEQPEGCADMALVTVRLTDKPQTLVVREVPGVQYTYMTRDPWRNFACYTTRGGGRYAGFKFSLIDGHARNMRAYGHSDWALGENLLTWFSFCGYTPEQVIGELSDFEVVKNGPDEAIFRYTSLNASGGAKSEYIVRVPADSPAMRMDVTATFTALKKWPYDGNQFFDIFPFRGVWPQDWWYQQTLWMANDGRWKTRDTVKGTFEGDEKVESITGGGFFALYGSDRGNMVMLVKNIRPTTPVDYIICGNYIDYHMTVKFLDQDGKPTQPEAGFQASAQYQLAVWGDKTVTREKLLEIGKKSVEAKNLVLP